MTHGHDHNGESHARGCGCGGHPAGRPSRDWADAGAHEMVCPCHGLNKGQLVEAIQAGAFTLPLLKTMTQAGRGRDCQRLHPEGRSCQDDLAELIRLYASPPQGWATGGCGH